MNIEQPLTLARGVYHNQIYVVHMNIEQPLTLGLPEPDICGTYEH